MRFRPRNASKNVGAKIMNYMNAVKKKIKKRVHSETLIRELLAQKCRKRSDKDCENFCFGINCSYVVHV